MLELRGLGKRLGGFVLEDLSLSLEPGEYFVLLGPSGAGKTVLLELVAGLLAPDRGSISWEGGEITALPPEARDFSLVYQDYALFPHMSVEDNIGYGLRARGATRKESRARVGELAELVGLTGLLGRKPATLSGGEQQRVALARALAARPRLLLLDEPLAAVDVPTRLRLRRELRKLHRETGVTCLHVTHDADEAVLLGGRIGVMLGGRLRQVGRAEDLFRAPSDREVAEFLGLRNILPVRWLRDCVFAAHGAEIAAAAVEPWHGHAWVKPEEVVLSREPFSSSARNQLEGRVLSLEPSGVLWAVQLACGELPLAALLTHASLRELGLEPGQKVYATFKSSAVHCF